RKPRAVSGAISRHAPGPSVLGPQAVIRAGLPRPFRAVNHGGLLALAPDGCQACRGQARQPMDELYDTEDMTGLAAHVRKGDVTPAELLETAIARCERVNGELNAVVLRFDDVARRKIDAGLPEGPLRG